ncbi:MAG: type II toxin-antitoxin system Phd/YefM family antitoxin [Firmicutes bacterium]|nr:type II toxin-antitoxin system Phd/YefM family antitoxin [Bacillota bacterium]
MLNTNITNFRQNIFTFIEQTVKHNEPVNVSTKDGNAIVLSEADYNGLMETLDILSIPAMKDKLLTGKATPVADCVPESEVEW